MTGQLTTTCRSCGARIEFVRTIKGNRIPLDLTSGPKANLVINDAGLVEYVKAGEGTRISHFVTCPDAARFRRDRGRK